MPAPPIRTVEEFVAYENPFVRVHDDHVLFGGDRAGRYVRIVESNGRPGVAALAVSGGTIALVHSYRYPIQSWEWGIPRGFAHGDDPAESITRELREELGAAPDSMEHLVTVTPNSGLLAGRVEIFHARYATPVSAPLDTAEIAAVRWEPVAGVRAAIASGAIRDGFTVAALGAAWCRGLFG